MSQEQQPLRFSVEESVWFQKGQEVSELLSISLDPEISIHEHDHYISIRGALQLTGEYKIDREANTEDQLEFSNVRYVNEVQVSDDGVSILKHSFPVDITIPSDRVDNLEEVYVSIDSFDYELPDLKCLKLTADLSISGILNEVSTPSENVRDVGDEVFGDLMRGQQPAFEDNERTDLDTDQLFSSFYKENQFVSSAAEEDVDKSSFVSSKEEREEKVSQDIKAASHVNSVNEENSDVEESEQDQQKDLYDPFVVEVRKQEQEQEQEPQEVQYSFFSKSESQESDVEESDAEETDDRDESDPKDAHYLTSLFARDDEEDFSRVKMCIVQQGDTIERICERYDISVQQLLRVNDFHADQDVYEGQILYIPAYSTSK